MIRTVSVGALLLCVVALVAMALSVRVTPSEAAMSYLKGYAWSSTIGWIDMSSVGVQKIGDVRVLNGWGWSSNIGWVKFGGLSSFPSGPTQTNASVADDGSLMGFARACAGTADGVCGTMSNHTDGWDGWISLDGARVNGRGCDAPYGECAWGADVVGYVDFSPTEPPCENQTTRSCSTDNMSVVTTGTNMWCEDVNTTVACEPDEVCASGRCTPDTSSDDSDDTDDTSNDNNDNTNGEPTGTFTADPLRVRKGSSTTLTWSTVDAVSCEVSGTNGDSHTGTASPAGGYISNPLQQQTIFTLRCTAADGAVHELGKITVNVIPVQQEY